MHRRHVDTCARRRCAVAADPDRLRDGAERRRSQRQGRRGAQGVVQGAGTGEARPPRTRTTRRRSAANMPARRCRRTSPSGSRSQPRVDQVAGRRQATWATGRTASGSRRKGAACSIPTIPKGPVGANCYAVPSARAAGALVRHDRPDACTSSASCAATPTRCASTRTARSTTPKPTTRARTCRASATAAS